MYFVVIRVMCIMERWKNLLLLCLLAFYIFHLNYKPECTLKEFQDSVSSCKVGIT